MQSYPNMEIIVIDNDSTIETEEFLNNRHPEVRSILIPVNLGFAGGSNIGIKASKGDYILILNPDTIPKPDFVESLVQCMESGQIIGMCMGKMLYPDGRLNSAGICISLSGAAWDRGMGEPDTGQYNEPGEILGPCGGAALYNRKMLEEVGGFDNDFFLFMEDVDIGVRGRLAGWKCYYCPQAIVSHHHGMSIKQHSDDAVYYGNRNVIWYPVKNFPLLILLFSLPWIIGRTICVIVYYTAKGQCTVILKSKIDGILGIPLMIRKRKYVNRSINNRLFLDWIHVWAKIPSSKRITKRY